MTDSTAPTAPPEWFTERILLLVSAAAIVVGSLGPWIVATSGFGSISVAGMDGDGKYTAIGGLLVGLFTLIRKYIGAVIAAAIVTGVGVIDYADAQDRVGSVDSDMVRASIGWGLYAVLGGGAVAFALGIICSRRGKQKVTHVEFAPSTD